MKSFSSFFKSTLLEFAEGPTIFSGYKVKPHTEYYMPGGSAKSKEIVPLISLEHVATKDDEKNSEGETGVKEGETSHDFFALETLHGRLAPPPKKNILMDAHAIMEDYDKDMKALPFNPSTNYHGNNTFINEIISKLKNIEIHGTNEGGKVDKKAMKYVLDHINHIILNENGLKGHLEAFNKLSERTFNVVRSDKKYRSLPARLESELSHVFDKGVKMDLIYDTENNVMRKEGIEDLIVMFKKAKQIISETFNTAEAKPLLHRGFLYDEGGVADPDELKKYLKGEKSIEPGLLKAFKERSSKPLSKEDNQKIYVNFVKTFAKKLKNTFKIQYDFENMATMTNLPASKVELIFGEKKSSEEVKEINQQFQNAKKEALHDVFHNESQGLKLYMDLNNGKFEKVNITNFSKVVGSMHRYFAKSSGGDTGIKDLFKVSAVNTALGKNVKVSNTQKKEDALDSNKKLSSTEGTVMDFTLPAYRGLVLMKRPWKDIYGKQHPANSLAVINTCPAAGACKNFCYATKGGYIMFGSPQLQAAKMLTKLVNEPEKFKQEMIKAIKSASKSKKLTLRWHDAGDFFTTGYFELVMDIAKKTPDVLHYAYTKRADLLKKSISGEIAKIPDNFVFDISKGSIYDKSLSKELIKDGLKFSDVTPTKFKKSELTPEILSQLNGKKDIDVRKEEVVFKFPSKDELKNLDGEKDDIYKDLHEGYIMALKHVYGFDIPIKTYTEMTKIKEGSQGKFHVLVYGDDGDAGAFRKDVVGSLLVIH